MDGLAAGHCVSQWVSGWLYYNDANVIWIKFHNIKEKLEWNRIEYIGTIPEHSMPSEGRARFPYNTKQGRQFKSIKATW